MLSPSALLSRLSHRLHILTNGPQDLPTRPQTMREAIRWSYDLLTPEEQVLFHRLSVLIGGFSIDAAEYVGATTRIGSLDSDSSSFVLDLVSSLSDKSLLHSGSSFDDEPRFAMLETVREFGLEQLELSGEMEILQDRHAAWCQELVDNCWRDWERRHEVDRAVNLLDREHDNLSEALAYLGQ